MLYERKPFAHFFRCSTSHFLFYHNKAAFVTKKYPPRAFRNTRVEETENGIKKDISTGKSGLYLFYAVS